MRVIFIATDVIEILMMGGTQKLENFRPRQIGKFVLGILKTLHSFSVSYNCIQTGLGDVSGIVLLLYVCRSCKYLVF